MDVNRFVRLLMVKKKWLGDIEDIDNPSDNVNVSVGSENVEISIQCESFPILYKDHIMIKCLHKSQQYSVNTIHHIKVPRPAMVNSNFYPLQSRSEVIDNFQELIQSDIIKLHCNNINTKISIQSHLHFDKHWWLYN